MQNGASRHHSRGMDQNGWYGCVRAIILKPKSCLFALEKSTTNRNLICMCESIARCCCSVFLTTVISQASAMLVMQPRRQTFV
jgi:hypothetical protein